MINRQWVVASQGQTIAQLEAAQVALGNTVIWSDADNMRTLVDVPSGASLIGVSDAFIPKGNIDCSGNPNFPAADAGWVYKVSVAGKIGGASGDTVQAGDELLCLLDGSTAGTKAQVGVNWNIVQGNVISTADVPASTDKNYVTDAQVTLLGNVAGRRLGNDAQYVRTTTGAQSLLGGNAVARAIIIVVEIDTTFAAGDGAAPIFAIGETGNATKFHAGITTGTAGDKLTFAGFLSANAALIITATAATGSTSTGAIHVTALALPEA